MIKLLSKGDLLYLFSQHVKTLIVNVFLFIIGSKTIPIASSQGWCWNTTSPKEGDKDLCRTHKDAKILVLLPSMFFEIIPNKIVDLIALYMFIQHQYAYSPYYSLQFPEVLTRRICLTIRSFFCWLSFP